MVISLRPCSEPAGKGSAIYESAFPYILGVLIAWVTWYPARRLTARSEQWYFTVIITAVAIGFIGFPIEDGNIRGILYELLALIVFIVLIVMSKSATMLLLPVVWFAHGAWDLAYLLEFVPVDKPAWVVQLCVSYDWLLAGYLFYRVPAWRATQSEKRAEKPLRYQ